ncbi:hypothetical protein J6590_010839 [Homalodisca vitripennis]|nr:hypothetical protein J6590_010839 [Homalodisca vitripennis]
MQTLEIDSRKDTKLIKRSKRKAGKSNMQRKTIIKNTNSQIITEDHMQRRARRKEEMRSEQGKVTREQQPRVKDEQRLLSVLLPANIPGSLAILASPARRNPKICYQ